MTSNNSTVREDDDLCVQDRRVLNVTSPTLTTMSCIDDSIVYYHFKIGLMLRFQPKGLPYTHNGMN